MKRIHTTVLIESCYEEFTKRPYPYLLAMLPSSHVNNRRDELDQPLSKRQRYLLEVPQDVAMLSETYQQVEEQHQQPMALEEPARESPVERARASPMPMTTVRYCPPCFAHRFCRVGNPCVVESDLPTYYRMHYEDTYSVNDEAQPAMMAL